MCVRERERGARCAGRKRTQPQLAHAAHLPGAAQHQQRLLQAHRLPVEEEALQRGLRGEPGREQRVQVPLRRLQQPRVLQREVQQIGAAPLLALHGGLEDAQAGKRRRAKNGGGGGNRRVNEGAHSRAARWRRQRKYNGAAVHDDGRAPPLFLTQHVGAAEDEAVAEKAYRLLGGLWRARWQALNERRLQVINRRCFAVDCDFVGGGLDARFQKNTHLCARRGRPRPFSNTDRPFTRRSRTARAATTPSVSARTPTTPPAEASDPRRVLHPGPRNAFASSLPSERVEV